MQLLSGHAKRVHDLAFSPDGHLLASCGNDKTVRVWDTLTGESHVLFDDEGICDRVAFTPEGEHLLVRLRHGGLHVWNLHDRRCVARPIPSSTIAHRGGLAVAATGLVAAKEWVSTRPLVGSLRIWDTATWEEYLTRETPEGRLLNGLAFDSTGTQLVTPSGIFDARTGGALLDVPFVADTLAWSPTSPLIAGTGTGTTAWVVDAETGERVATLPVGELQAKDVAFSPDGKSLVVVSGEGVARVWETEGWGERTGFAWDIGPLRCIAFSPDGQRAACAGHRGVIMVWDWDF